MDLDTRGKFSSEKYGTNPSPARHAKGNISHGKTTTRGVTKPQGEFMVGRGTTNDVNLSVYTNRRCGHKGK